MSDYKTQTLTSQVPLNFQFGSDSLKYDSVRQIYSVQLNQTLPPCSVSINKFSLNKRFVTVTTSMNASVTIVYNGNTYTSKIPSGSYSFNDLANYIYQWQVQNNIWLQTQLNQIWTPIIVALSPSNDRAVMTINPVPSSLTGPYNNWSNSNSGLVLTGFAPQISVTSDLNNLLGGGFPLTLFPTNPATPTSSTLLSLNLPSNLYFDFKLNMVAPPISSPYVSGNPALYQSYSRFATDGSMETYDPQNRAWFFIANNNSQVLSFSITDMIGVPINLANPDIFISLDCLMRESLMTSN